MHALPPPQTPINMHAGSWRHLLPSKLYRARNVFLKYWWVVLFGASVGLAVGAWKVAHQRTIYVSTARMIVSGKINVMEGAHYAEEMGFFMSTQRELMQDAAVRERAEARVRETSPGTPNSPVALSVEPLPQTTIFILKATGSEPRYPQLILDAVMKEYISARRELRTQKSEDVEISIEDQIKREQIALGKEEEKLLAFQRQNNVGFLEQEGNSAGAYLGSLNTRLAELKNESKLLDLFQIDQTFARDKNHSSGSGLSREGDLRAPSGAEMEYLRASQQIEVLRAERDSYAKDLRPKHPIIVDLDHQISQQQQLMETYRKRSVEDLERRREAARLEIQNLEQTIKEWEKKALDLSERLAEYYGIQAGISRKRTQLESLIRSKDNVEISHNVDQEIVSIRERASPGQPQTPGVARTLGCAIAVGLLTGLMCLALIDQLDDRISSSAEFQSHFRERILAQIPRVSDPGKVKSAMRPLAPDNKQHAFSEAFRSLRSSVNFLPIDGEAPKILLIASAVPNEGKSTVSTNFAITLAFSGARVLLVDGDLRRGDLHSVFGLPNDHGFGDVLAGECPRHAAIKSTNFPNLYFLSRGSNVANPGELYLSNAADYFLKAVHREFDFVLIDSSPVMAADDTTSLAPKADAVIFVFRFASSKARASRRALEMLHERQANVIGVVCNDVSEAMQEYNYYTYSEYYGPAQSERAKV